MNVNIFELQARYDSRKSFYGKAHVIDEGDGTLKLVSYETHVATFNKETGVLSVMYDETNTTKRHIREFARQNGIYLTKVKCGEYK